MKHLILSLLVVAALFGVDKQIIIGSYLDERNSVDELRELTLHVEQDSKLQFLLQKNALKAESKKIEKYYVVSVLPLSDYVQLLRTLESLQAYYPDAYVIDAPTPVVIQPEVPEIEIIEVVTVSKPVMKREVVVVVEEVPKKAKIETKTQEPKEELKDNKDFLLILLALAIIALAIYMRKKAKKEE